MQTQPETLEFVKYVLIFTNRSMDTAEQIMELYQMRWQIELAFERLKSLAQLGQLPKHDERSSRAWLYDKLFVALLVQKNDAYRSRHLHPEAHGSARSNPPALGASLILPFNRSSKPSNRN